MNHAFDRPRLSRVSFDDAKPSAVCRRQVVVRSSSGRRQVVVRSRAGCILLDRVLGRRDDEGVTEGRKHTRVFWSPPCGDQSGTSRGPVGDQSGTSRGPDDARGATEVRESARQCATHSVSS